MRTCACQNYWSLFFICLFLFHCQAVSPQAALLLGHAIAVFFPYISFNRYANFFVALPTFLARLNKSTQFRK